MIVDEEKWMCGAFQFVRDGYRCTKPYGHTGPHRAVIDGHVVAEWPSPRRALLPTEKTGT